jgi:hypothetical protein
MINVKKSNLKVFRQLRACQIMQKSWRKNRTSSANQSEYLFTQLQIQSLNASVEETIAINLRAKRLIT